jgi:hypothetical protein
LEQRYGGSITDRDKRYFPSAKISSHFWSPPSLLSNGVVDKFLGDEAAVARLVMNWEYVELYFHSTIGLHDMFLN